MIWRLRRHEPSFSSMNEKSFESRRVRTQPWTWTPGMGPALPKAALTVVTPAIRELCRAPPLRQAKAGVLSNRVRSPKRFRATLQFLLPEGRRLGWGCLLRSGVAKPEGEIENRAIDPHLSPLPQGEEGSAGCRLHQKMERNFEFAIDELRLA